MNNFFPILCIVFTFAFNDLKAAPSFGFGTSQNTRDAEERNKLKRLKQRNEFYSALNSNLNFCIEMSERDIYALMKTITNGSYLYMNSLGDIKKIFQGYSKKIRQNC